VIDTVSNGVFWPFTVMLSVVVSVFTFNTLLTSLKFF
jgi:hypothetical protein